MIGDATGVSYQGVTTVGQTGTLKSWEMDGMRWHQMLVDGIVFNYEQIDSHRVEMQKAEKRGYRTLSWVVMNYLTTTCQLESSLGEPLFGSYPSLHVVHDRDEWSVHGSGRAWMFLDAIAPMLADAWLQSLLEGGGGLVASTSLTNIPSHVREFLSQATYSFRVARIPAGLKRVKGWWRNGDTQTLKGRQTLYLWSLQANLTDRVMTEVCEWLERDFMKELYPLPKEDRSQSYWKGSEAGRLGLYDRSTLLMASDGSAGDSELGAGYTIQRDGSVIDWDGSVEGADEQTTSFRPEVAGLGEGLRKIRSDEPASFLVDNESVLRTILSWVGSSHQPSPLSQADADMVLDVIWSLSESTAFRHFYKVKSHRGEPFNTRADWLADRGTSNIQCVVPRARKARPCFSVPGYTGVWCAKVQRAAEAGAANIFADLKDLNKGKLDSFLLRAHMGRSFLGHWWKKRGTLPDADFRCAVQIVTDTYPSPANLKLWGLRKEGCCEECGHPWGNMAHIQGYCSATQEARIACHNRCRELITTCITQHAKGWVTFPETTCEGTLHVLRHLTGISIPSMPRVDFCDPKEGVTRDLEWNEARSMRIDELAINTQRRCLWYNEMTRGWDRDEEFHLRKDEFKRAWYKPWIDHLIHNLTPHGWSVKQLNFTVGVRATIPEFEWRDSLDHYDIPQERQNDLMESVVDTVMMGAIEVVQAYKSHFYARIGRDAQQKTAG
eukprot:77900-Rhodomonas_salina.1